MKPHTDISDPRVVKALAHPLRVRILSALDQRTASPSELADELEAPLGNVSYHVRQLAGLGLIKLVKKTPRRGAIEHHYKAVARSRISDEAWGEVPSVVKQALVASMLEQIGSAVNAAAAADGFSRPDVHLTRTEAHLDERGWSELAAELARTVKSIERIEAASAKRLRDADGSEGLITTIVMMQFEGRDQSDGVGSSRPRARAAG